MASLDLHGLTWVEAREELVAAYNEGVRAQDTLPLEVIHGYGASGQGGKLRTAVRTFLADHGVHFTPGEHYDRNPGHTLVTLGRPLPNVTDRLQSEILAYCANGRTRTEIAGKFRRHGDPAIAAAIKSLQAMKRLETVTDNGRKKFRSR